MKRTNAGIRRRNGAAAGMRILGQRLLGRTATGSIETNFKHGRNKMSDNNRLNNYDELPLVLDVADIRRIMGISRVSAYELVHTPGFPAFRSGRLIKVSKKAFFDWMAKGTEPVPGSDK